MQLRVIAKIPGHEVGDLITDESEVSKILASESSAFVVKVAAPPADEKPSK